MSRLALIVAMLASLWPAAALVEAAGGHVSLPLPLPRVAPPSGVGLVALEARQHELAMQAAAFIDDTPAPDVASRAAVLRDQAAAWYRRHRDSARAAAIAAAMHDLDLAIAALAQDPAPGAQLAFERSLAAYDTQISATRLI